MGNIQYVILKYLQHYVIVNLHLAHVILGNFEKDNFVILGNFENVILPNIVKLGNFENVIIFINILMNIRNEILDNINDIRSIE